MTDVALAPCTEAEVLALREAPEVLSLARSIERGRIEASNERLMTRPGSDAYRRWKALLDGAMPDADAIRDAKRALERRDERANWSGLRVSVTVTEPHRYNGSNPSGPYIHIANWAMSVEELFEGFHLSSRDQFAVIEAVKAGRPLTLELIGGRCAEIKPFRGSGR